MHGTAGKNGVEFGTLNYVINNRNLKKGGKPHLKK